jgi:hypothetical protein
VRAGRLWRVPAQALDEYLDMNSHSNGDDE